MSGRTSRDLCAALVPNCPERYHRRMRAKHVFGLTPWGRFFIDAMETLADDGRLARGRSYAGNGSVVELNLDGGTVKAKVRGNYAPYYRVSIRFKPLPGTAARTIEAIFASDPLLGARVARGEIPDGLIERLEAAGAFLVPRRWSEIERSCSCPDYGDPCKHQAAVYYLLAQEIDRDPLVLFRLRGIDSLSASKSSPLSSTKSASGVASKAASGKKVPAVASGVIIPDPLQARLVKPWPEPVLEGDPLAGAGSLASYAAAIPAMLPPSRGLVPFDLRVVCTAFYHRFIAILPELLEPPVPMDGPQARAFASSVFAIEMGAEGSIRLASPVRSSAREEPVASALKARRQPEWGSFHGFLEIAQQFASCGEREGSASYVFLRAFFSAIRSIASACAFVPDVHPGDGRFSVIWKPARFGSDVETLLASLEPAVPVPRYSGSKGLVPDARSTVQRLAIAYLSELARFVDFTLPSKRENEHAVIRALFGSKAVSCRAPGSRVLPAALDSWVSVFDMAEARPPLELTIRGSKKRVDKKHLGAAGQEGSFRLSAALVAEGGTRIALHKSSALSAPSASDALSFAALLSNFVPALAGLGTQSFVELGQRELADFVVDAAPLLGRFGVVLILPKELKSLATPRPALQASRKPGLVSYLDTATAFSFDWTVAIGEERLNPAEFASLLSSGLSLVRWRNQWVRIDPAEAARVMARVSGKAPTAMEALRTALSGEAEAEGDFAEILDVLSGAGRRASDDAPVPASLLTELRTYQERGYRWILGNLDRGFGCLLADDMGLGKTVQTIAVLLSLKEAGKLCSGALVCAPASLLTNWERELAKFAPSLSVCLYYGSARKKHAADVTLSSYETWLRDQKKLASYTWSMVILDEAHYIKNPDSRRAKAVKSIQTERRLALTGTPVENNLAELWSVFDFSLPGYLGTLTRFSAEYRRPIELDRSTEVAAGLRRAIGPFILRRLKTDKAIAADLPDKIVVDEYATLTPAQAALYQAIASDGLSRLESSGKESRLGLVLALITALKQASNHPRNYDKEGPGGSELSGKARLLLALLESAFEAGERVLVFSQYVEMLSVLHDMVSTELGVKPYLLHGGLSKKRRDEQVDRFQSERGPGVFLVSLKAGGVGLNLTAASRVVHYDLWFNPAVENQATDRAFRIGQHKNVFVHRLITRDTIEERIDAMIASKRDLSELTVRSGESWIADLSNAELRELVALR